MKTAVVTGGAKGIGRCLVQELVAAGYELCFIDKDARAGQELAQRTQAHFIQADLASETAIAECCEAIAQCFPRLDLLVNNANEGDLRGLASPCSYADFMRSLAVGLAAPYELSSRLQHLMPQGASIVNISSTRSRMSQANTEAYSASKGGLDALTHAMAVTLAGRVRVNAISPGWVDCSAWQGDGVPAPEHSEADAAQHPAGRVGEPGDIARAVLFLADGRNSFITGQNLAIDGGMTCQMIYHGDAGWNYEPTNQAAH